MKLFLSSAAAAVLGLAIATTAPARAEGGFVHTAPDNGFAVFGAAGYSWLKGNELVYDAAGNRISHLIWETRAPVLTLGAEASVHRNWKLTANGTFGFAGNSMMRDYDWLTPHSPSFAFDDWSHRSVHPDTILDRYLDIDIAIGRDFVVSDVTTINLHGGFKYTNVKWTGRGGTFVYSDQALRDWSGSFASGLPVITYEQHFPGLFVGLEAGFASGPWSVKGLVRGGATVGATAVDHHWLRDLRFDEQFDASAFVSLGAKFDYRVSQRAAIHLAGSFDRYFHKKSDVTIYHIPSGARLAGPITDGGGMDFTAFKLNAGLSLAF